MGRIRAVVTDNLIKFGLEFDNCRDSSVEFIKCPAELPAMQKSIRQYLPEVALVAMENFPTETIKSFVEFVRNDYRDMIVINQFIYSTPQRVARMKECGVDHTLELSFDVEEIAGFVFYAYRHKVLGRQYIGETVREYVRGMLAELCPKKRGLGIEYVQEAAANILLSGDKTLNIAARVIKPLASSKHVSQSSVVNAMDRLITAIWELGDPEMIKKHLRGCSLKSKKPTVREFLIDLCNTLSRRYSYEIDRYINSHNIGDL